MMGRYQEKHSTPHLAVVRYMMPGCICKESAASFPLQVAGLNMENPIRHRDWPDVL
jgi:hypothetical protein